MASRNASKISEVEVAKSDQLPLPLQPVVSEFGNQPVLMPFRFFSLSSVDQEFEEIVQSPRGEAKIRIKTESSKDYGVACKVDQNLFMYVITKMARMKSKGRVPRKVEISVGEYLKASGLQNSGQAYARVRQSLQRLRTTSVHVNIEVGDRGMDSYFNWLQEFHIKYHRENLFGESKKRMSSVIIEPANWIYQALLRDNEIIGYSQEYFDLRSPIIQRVYEVVNSDQTNDMFKISINQLLDHTGWGGDTRDFKKNLKRLLSTDEKTGKVRNPIPDHAIYPYSLKSPSKSCSWETRVLQKDQYIVFVRGEKQRPELDVHLDQVPDWNSRMDPSELVAFGAVFELENVMA